MMALGTCHYCTRPADEECHACGRLYCGEHGEDVCLRCLSPEAAIPSATVYRGAVLALVAASAVAIFVAVNPPETRSSQDEVRTVQSPTPQSLATATATPRNTGANTTPTASRTPGASQTASSTTTTGSPTASATASTKSHTVAPGETLSSIASLYNTTVDVLKSLNSGLTDLIQPGQVINLP